MRTFFIIQSCITLAGGIVFPFYVLLLHEAGSSALVFGGLYAIFTVSSAIAYIGTDQLVHYFSYQQLLVVSNLCSGIALFGLTTVDTLAQLAFVQVVLGVAFALPKNLEKIILAEHTVPENRITKISHYHASMSAVLAVSVLGTGWLVDTFSINILFYCGGVVYLIAALYSLRLKI